MMIVSVQGLIFSCEVDFANMFGCDSPSDVMGYSVTDMIPSLVLPSIAFSDSQVSTTSSI